ncbi:MAG: hypothetical protein AAGI48_13780 [Verrucomicrobiota bacterium]
MTGSTRLTNRISNSGFALVVTVTMMVLLALLAIGLLSLSTVALRSSGSDRDLFTARANARLALTLAIGELQKSMGPDKRISANSEILGESVAKRNLMGVWQSWDPDIESSPDYENEKEQRFERWLVSTRQITESNDLGFASDSWDSDRVELLGEGAFGSTGDEEDMSFAQVIPILDSEGIDTVGGYAWHVTDESQKARVNAYRDPEAETLAERVSLAGGHRPAAHKVRGVDGSVADFLPTDESREAYERASELESKLISVDQFSLLESGSDFKPFRNFLTPYSMGLLTNVRKGGLKKDLSLALGSGRLPNELGGDDGRIYESVLDLTGDSDPFWSRLAAYHNLYKESENLTISADSDEVYDINVNEEDSGISSVEDPPRSYPVAPVMARLDIYATAVVRDRVWRNSKGIHLNFCPVITLLNPYNHSISFEKLKYDFNNIPMGVRVYVGGKNNSWYNPRIVPIGKMANAVRGETNLEHYNSDFTLYLGNWSDTRPVGSSDRTRGEITLKPGQSMIFSPYPSARASAANSLVRIYADQKWGKRDDNNRTNRNVKLAPGFRGLYSGDERLDMNPVYFPYSEYQPEHWQFLGYPLHFESNDAAGLDPELIFQVGIVDDPKTVAVRGQAGAPPELGGQPQTKFSVSSLLTTTDGQEKMVGGYEYDFNEKDKFDDMLGMPEVTIGGNTSRADNPNRALRFPNVDNRRSRLYASDMYQGLNDRYVDYNSARTFARFTLAAKTTRGGVYETGSREPAARAANVLKDGQLASKPFLNGNFAIPIAAADLSRQKRGGFPFEMSLITYGDNPGEVEDDLEILDDNEAPVLTGSTVLDGQKSGAVFDLPVGPLTAISDLRRGNVLSSQHPPYTTHPVANSKVPAMMSPSGVIERKRTGTLLDHAFLANHALYDNFFFSSVAEYDGVSVEQSWKDFLEQRNPLPARSLQPYLPADQNLEQAMEVVSDENGAYTEVAQFLMTQAPFNVNSTNVEAWKAVLSSLSDTEITFYDTLAESVDGELLVTTPMLGLNLPCARSTDPSADLFSLEGRAEHWNGYRSLSEEQVERLAEEIVEQVRLRGPFLSFSEFVNRQIGPNSANSRMGALEAAIEAAGLNEEMFSNQVDIEIANVSDTENFNFETPEMMEGNPAEGAPSWLMQGDLMKVLEPGGTVRSDTFVIRTLGQAQDSTGRVTARAYLEAVVQRVPEFVDPANQPDAVEADLIKVNEEFGRQFRLVSYRWLAPEEI